MSHYRHHHRHHAEWWLAPVYAVKFMFLALACVLWLYGTMLWYMGCTFALAAKAVALAWNSHQAGTLRTAATVTALGQLAGQSFPAPPWTRKASRLRAALPR